MRQAVNILFLGGAKRVSMAGMIMRAGDRLGLDVNLFSYELFAEVPVAEVATVIRGLRWSDPDIMADLHNVVVENHIDIIIPFVDPAVEIAARFCNSVADVDCFTPGGNADMSRLMFDKVEADALFRTLGFPLPHNAVAENVAGRVIAKPRKGSASKGLRVMSHEEYEKFFATDESREDYLCQEYIEHRKEFTVDCYVTSKGCFVCAVPRERLEVQGGEVMSTETLHDEEIESLSRRILHDLKLTGPVTIQYMREVDATGSAGRLMLMEINPRLGGGAVCAVHAGADLPMFILSDWLGHSIEECNTWRAGVKICRYMQEVAFENGLNITSGK